MALTAPQIRPVSPRSTRRACAPGCSASASGPRSCSRGVSSSPLAVVIGAPRLDRVYSDRQSALGPDTPARSSDVQETGGQRERRRHRLGRVRPAIVQPQRVCRRRTSTTPTTGATASRSPCSSIPDDRSVVTLPGENYLPGWFGPGGDRARCRAGSRRRSALAALRRLPKVKRALAAGPWRSVVGRRIRAGVGRERGPPPVPPERRRWLVLALAPATGEGERVPRSTSPAPTTASSSCDPVVATPALGPIRHQDGRRVSRAVSPPLTLRRRHGRRTHRRGGPRSHVYEFKDPDLAAGLDDDGLDGRPTVTVWHGPSGRPPC